VDSAAMAAAGGGAAEPAGSEAGSSDGRR
jgi:hypothetical protein